MQHRPWNQLANTLGVSSLALLVGCAPAPEPSSAEVAIEQAHAAVADVKQQLEQTGQKIAQTEDRLRAFETVRSTGAKIVTKPDAAEIVSLDLRGIEVTDALAEQIAILLEIERLSLNQSVMSLAGWQLLGNLSSVQQLDLRDCPINNEQLHAILGGMPKLKALRMSGTSGVTQVDDQGLAALTNCPALKVLAIDGLWITDAGIQHATQCKKLSELYAASTTLNDDSGELLANLPELKKLRLAKTGFGTAGLAKLLSLTLEDLDISEASGIDDDSMAVVGQMKSLKRLNLWRDTVGDAGVAHLAGLTELQWLNLDNTHLTDAGLKHLAGMQQLTFLHLGSTGVTDAGMNELVGLKALKDLKVTRSAVTEAGVEVVQQAIPGINVQLKYIEGE